MTHVRAEVAKSIKTAVGGKINYIASFLKKNLDKSVVLHDCLNFFYGRFLINSVMSFSGEREKN